MSSADQPRTLAIFIRMTLDKIASRHPKMTDLQIADEVGVQPETVSRWRTGTLKRIEIRNLEKLLKIAGYQLGQCLHFPEELGIWKEIEAEVFNRIRREESGAG